jgi:hypothetical protein
VRTVHGTGCRPFEIDAFGIVARAMAGALELVLARFPVGCATKVRADGRNHEDSFGVADHPDAMRVLKFGIHSKAEVGRKADQEFGLRLIEGAWEEEPQEHQEIDAQEAQDTRHDESPASRDDALWIGIVAGEDPFQRICYVGFRFGFRRFRAWRSLEGSHFVPL